MPPKKRLARKATIRKPRSTTAVPMSTSKKAEAGVVTVGPVQLPDSTTDRPVVALHGPFDFPVGRSLEGDVRYVADVARTEASTTRDEFIVGCARTLDALELALRRYRTGLEPGDRRALAALENTARLYLEQRRPNERWYGPGFGDSLPARKKVDRPERIAKLCEFARTVALKTTGFKGDTRDRRPEAIARMMIAETWRSNIVDTRHRDRDDDVRELARVLRGKLRKGVRKEDPDRAVAPDLLVVWALKACGVSHGDANNWCKPLSV